MDYEKGNPRNLVQFSEYSDLAFTDTGVKIDDNSGPDQNTLWTSEKIYQMMNTPKMTIQPRTILPSLNQMQMQMRMPDERPTNSFGEHHPHIPRIFKPKWWFSRFMHSRNYYCKKCMNYKDYFFSSKYKNDTCYNCTCDCDKKIKKRMPYIPNIHNPIQPPQIQLPPMQAPMLSTASNFPQLRLPTITIGPPMVGNVSPNNNPNSQISQMMLR